MADNVVEKLQIGAVARDDLDNFVGGDDAVIPKLDAAKLEKLLDAIEGRCLGRHLLVFDIRDVGLADPYRLGNNLLIEIEKERAARNCLADIIALLSQYYKNKSSL